ncbi:TonB-dependent receptor [uncultured Tenacibaculum sp.]|uniref:SusC/RagA family TonB-linked outer membrane protein n=1 Tax=uncultured Tenacibaculum sp. TaxID=174713 RepID=UPI002635AA5A|nr:TonB-dependent receptor [uncultured Tenacibaculum sp.]
MKKTTSLKVHKNFIRLNFFDLDKIFKKLCAFIIIIFVGNNNAFAKNPIDPEIKNSTSLQEQISGTVSDSSGPLPGVNVVIKGTTKGVETDFDGNYKITAAGGNTVLIFSYVGYKTQEIEVGSKKVINVVLTPDNAKLEEVVVLGYTTKKKGELTGAVGKIDNEVIQRSSSKDIAKSLSGRVTGLNIIDRGGTPGAGNGGDGDTSNDATTILIRGKSTSNNNSPLILIDGIQSTTFSNLSPEDIESLTVLKDGAAAIYGSRAANGVILITTKRGKLGAPTINVSSSFTVSSFTQRPQIMNARQYAIYENEIAARQRLIDPNITIPFTDEQIDRFGTDPIRFPDTNWADVTFADFAPESRNSISISGGTETVKYFVSADAIRQGGLFRARSLQFDQNQVRSNLDIKMTDDIKIGVDIAGIFGDRNQPGVDLGNIYKHIYTNLPTDVGIYPNGLPARGGENGQNPFIMSSNESGFINTKTTNLRGRFSFDYNLDKITKGLKFKSFMGVRKIFTKTKSWYTPWTYYTFQEGTNEYIPETGFSPRGEDRILRETSNTFDQILLNATLNYTTKIKDDHSLNVIVGTEKLDSEVSNFFGERIGGFPSSDVPELFAGSEENARTNGSSGEGARFDIFGALSYDYMKKYFLDFTIRRDGSSNFGPGKRFGVFPGLSAAWALDKEKFLEKASWINALKIRASWAQLGNDRIAPFQFLSRFNFGSQNPNTPQPNFFVFGVDGEIFNGFSSTFEPNPNVTWEKSTQQNLGLTFSLFDNRLSGDVNYYFEKRTDILRSRNASTPDFVGVLPGEFPSENFGEVNNFGWELELSWADKIGNVEYSFGGNVSTNRNEVVFIDEPSNVPDALRAEGKSIDTYIVQPTAGIFRDQAQVDATAVKLPGTVEGEPIYVDTNGDGVIDDGDRIRLDASSIPRVQYGFYGGFKYNNFDFNFLFQGQADVQTLVFFDQAGSKPAHVFEDRWTPDNRNARYPRAFQQEDRFSGNQSGDVDNFIGADLWLHDGSFLRLKEVELAYTIDKKIAKIGDIRLFMRGFNLFTMFSEIADLGLDPEANGYNNFRGSTYSTLKSYTLGVNFNF